MLVLTLKMLGIVPECYPDTCECGYLVETNMSSDWDLSKSLTSLNCTNATCTTHSAFNIVNMLDVLGLKINLGPNIAEMIMEETDLKCHLDILGLTDQQITSLSRPAMLPLFRLRSRVAELNESGGITVAKYIQLWGLPNLGKDRANAIFGTISSLADFYSNIMPYTLEARNFIAEKLHQSPYTKSITDIINTLTMYKDELLRCIKYFNITPVSDTVIQVVITNEITRVLDDNGNQFKPRSKFVEWVSQKYGINVILNSSFSQKNTNFCIADVRTGTKKEKDASKFLRNDSKALQILSQGGQVGSRLVYSDEFIKLLETGQI